MVTRSLLQGSGDHAADSSAPASEAYIGSRGSSGGDDETGDMAHVAYLTKVLSDFEIREYSADPLAVIERNWNDVVFYHPLGQGDGLEPDFGPRGNHAILNNGTVTNITATYPNIILETTQPFFMPQLVAVGGATPKGPLGHPLHGPFGGPI